MAITIDDLKSTIKIEFDAVGNPIQPILVLAERNTEKLGVIENITDFNITGNLNAADEFSLTVYKYFNGNKCTLWDSIQNLCLIWVKEWDRWFQIKVDTNESDATTKKIEATSLSEAELSQIYLFEIEINTEDDIARDDYVEPTVFYNSEDSSISLLDRISEKIPHYAIEYVAPTLANIQRTFEFNETTIYDALQKIAEEIECIFILGSGSNDSRNPERTISAYDLCDSCDDCGYRGTISDGVCPDCSGTNITYGYGYDSMIFVDSDCLGDEIEITVDTDGYKTCFRLQSGDDLMDAAIAACNPNGSRYIWYFDDDTRASMSEELQEALAEYDEKYSSFEEITDDDIDFSDYNTLVAKYISDDLSVSTVDSITSFAELMQIYYDTIDFQLYLQSSYMPSVNTDELADIDNQIDEIEALNYTEVGVSVSLSNVTSTTAKSYVLAYIKTVVRQAYFDVEFSSFEYDTSKYLATAKVKVTSVSDEDTTATTSTIYITISDDYELYIQQRIEKTISNNSDDDETDTLIAMFESTSSTFQTTLTKHCLDNLNSYYNMCQTILDVLISYGIGSSDSDYYDIYYDYYNKLIDISDEISNREEEISVITALQEALTDKRTEIQESLNFESFFGEDLWKELCSYRREQTYENSNFVSTGLDNAELVAKALEFIELAQEQLYTAGTFQVSITTQLKNLLAIPEFESLVDNFAVGVWIHVKIDDTIYKLRLISYSIDFDNFDNITVEFSDAVKVKNGLTDTQSILEQTVTMATSYGYIAYQASKIASNTAYISGWVNDGLDATTVMLANSLDNQSVTFDEHGILVKQWDDVLEDYSKKQIKIINKGLYFTDDNWESVKTGVGNFIYYDPEEGTYIEGYGVIADTIVANIILSEKVGVYNTNNSITMDSNGLTITGGSDIDNTENLILIQRVDEDGNYEKLLYLDADGNLVIDGASTTITASALGDSFTTYVNYLSNYNFATVGIWLTEKLDSNDYYSIGYYDSGETYMADYSWITNSVIETCEIVTISSDEMSGLSDSVQCLHLAMPQGSSANGQLVQNIDVPIEGTCKFNITLGMDNRNADVMSDVKMYIDLTRTDIDSGTTTREGAFTLKASDEFNTYTTDNFDITEVGSYDVAIVLDTSDVEEVEVDDAVEGGDFSDTTSSFSYSSTEENKTMGLYSGSTRYWLLYNFLDAEYTDDGLQLVYNDTYGYYNATYASIAATSAELSSSYTYSFVLKHTIEGDEDGVLSWELRVGSSTILSSNSETEVSYTPPSDGTYSISVRYYYSSCKPLTITLSEIRFQTYDNGTLVSPYSYNNFTSNTLTISSVSSITSTTYTINHNGESVWEVGNGFYENDGILFADITSDNFDEVDGTLQALTLYYGNYDDRGNEKAYVKQTVSVPKSGYYVFKITHGQDLTLGNDETVYWKAHFINDDGYTVIFDEQSLTSSLTEYVSSEYYWEEGDYDLIFYYWTGSNEPVIDIVKIELLEVVYDINFYISNVEFLANADGYISSYVSSLTVQSNLIEATVKQLVTDGDIMSTTVSLDSEKVRVAWNKTSTIVQFMNDDTNGTGLFIQDSEDDDAKTLVSLTDNGLYIYEGAITVQDKNGKDVFYTDSTSKSTIFSGALDIEVTESTDEDDARPRKKVSVDSSGLYVLYRDGNTGSSYNNTFGINFSQDRVEFYNSEYTRSGYIQAMAVKDEESVCLNANDYLYLQATEGIYSSVSIEIGSDRNLKENIFDLTAEMSANIINALNPVEFTYKADEKNKIHYGLIAQEVASVLENNNLNVDNFALVGNHEGYYSLAYTEFIPLLIKTVQYQQKQIEELQEKINQITQ